MAAKAVSPQSRSVLVLLFPGGRSQPGTHKRQILVNAASRPGSGAELLWDFEFFCTDD